jgi:multidrug efflux pump subunit AcrA (membrane-fusion protein)
MSQTRTLAPLSALTRVPRTMKSHVLARLLGLSGVASIVLAALLPWQQNVSGAGRVIAWAPSERRQPIEAPVNGRVVRWWVHEGSQVKEGDPMVEILDNDPLLVERLATERAAVASKLDNYEGRARTLTSQIDTARAARRSEILSSEAKLRATTQKLRSMEQKLEAAEAGLETASLNLGRVKALAERGLTAQRDLELAVLAATKARTEHEAAKADVGATLGDLDAARASAESDSAERTLASASCTLPSPSATSTPRAPRSRRPRPRATVKCKTPRPRCAPPSPTPPTRAPRWRVSRSPSRARRASSCARRARASCCPSSRPRAASR